MLVFKCLFCTNVLRYICFKRIVRIGVNPPFQLFFKDNFPKPNFNVIVFKPFYTQVIFFNQYDLYNFHQVY